MPFFARKAFFYKCKLSGVYPLFIIISTVCNHYSLNRIKNKTVGQGQYSTAHWATKKEIKRTYKQIDFHPDEWRTNPDSRPTGQGIVVVYCKCKVIIKTEPFGSFG